MEKLSRNDHIDLYRHLAFCVVGGFFGCYAVLVHGGIMGNAQTVNLLELLLDALRGDPVAVALHLGALALYVLATMLTVVLPHLFGWDMHYLSPAVTAAAAVIIAFLPPELNAVAALYPVFFAMSMQWSSFGGARGFYSATIFSTNNTKQASLALANYLCDRDRAHLHKMRFYLLTLLCFHLGAAWAFGAVTLWDIRGALGVIPCIGWALFLAVCERRHEALSQEPEEPAADSAAHPESRA